MSASRKCYKAPSASSVRSVPDHAGTSTALFRGTHPDVKGLEEQDLVPAEAVESDPLAACLVEVADASSKEALHMR